MWNQRMLLIPAIFFLALVSCTRQAAVAEEEMCQVPEHAKEWDSNPDAVTLDVYWTDGLESTCTSRQSCNDTMDVNPNATVTVTQEDHMIVQLIPVELQPGNKLRFHPMAMEDLTFPFIYKVSEEAFIKCFVEGWDPITEQETSQPFDVRGDLLTAGNNYFVVKSKSLLRCDNGLRLNVTVKTDMCQHNMTQQMCSGRGQCVTYKGQPSFTCQCCGNYKGSTCNTYDACLSNPCYHGSECLHNDTTNSINSSNDMYDYYCKCPLGYDGDQCEHEAVNVCDIIICQNGASCTGNSTYFDCLCEPGYNGTYCDVDIDECETSPCRHGRCIDRPNGFDCDCYPGYHGDTCEAQRQRCYPNPCHHGGYGENKTVGGQFDFECHCPHKWQGKACTEQAFPCQDNPCHRHGVCVEHGDGFHCQCEPGFTGSLCEININDCEPNPCHYHGLCRDQINGHSCLCLHAHAGPNCQYTIDIFNPVLDNIDAIDRANRLSEENKNLYIMAATLCTCLVVALTVLVVCYCRRNQAAVYSVCGVRIPYMHRAQSTDTNLAFSVDVANNADCPMTSDAFFKNEPGCGPVTNQAFQNHLV